MQTQQRTWTPMVLTQLLVVLAVLVSGIAGAGVLRGRDGGDDVLQVARKVSTANAQETFRATFEIHVKGSGIDVAVKGETLLDNVRKLASGSVDAPGIGPLEFVSAGDTTYLKLPGGKADASGKHWYGFTSPQGAAALGGQDPLAYLTLLGDPGEVRTVGEEKVHGVQTTHYTVQLDPKRLADEIAKSPSASAIPSGLLRQVKDSTIDLWVDDRNLPRRMRMKLAIQKVTASFVFEYLDYGGSVDVTVPDPSDVRQIPGPQQLGSLLPGLRAG